MLTLYHSPNSDNLAQGALVGLLRPRPRSLLACLTAAGGHNSQAQGLSAHAASSTVWQARGYASGVESSDDGSDAASKSAVAANAQLSYAELAASIARLWHGVGPFTLGELSFGLQAVARKHKEQRLTYDIKGQQLLDRDYLLWLLDGIDMAHSTYKINRTSMCAVSPIRLASIRRFQANNSPLRPAYFIAVDHVRRQIVLGLRGTKSMHDLLTNICGDSHPYSGGHVHWGMLRAAEHVLHQEMPTLARLTRSYPGHSVLLVGHSLGAGVAALMAHMLNTRPELRHQLRAAPSVAALAVAPPALMSKDLAAECAPFVTSVIHAYDVVPRFSLAAVNALHKEVEESGWYDELQKSVVELEYVQGITRALSSASTGTADAAAHVQHYAIELLSSRQLRSIRQALGTVADKLPAPPSALTALLPGSSDSTSTSPSPSKDGQQGQDSADMEEHDDAAASQKQLEVLRAWLADVSTRLPPVTVRANDIVGAADAAVDKLIASLAQVMPKGALPWQQDAKQQQRRQQQQPEQELEEQQLEHNGKIQSINADGSSEEPVAAGTKASAASDNAAAASSHSADQLQSAVSWMLGRRSASPQQGNGNGAPEGTSAAGNAPVTSPHTRVVSLHPPGRLLYLQPAVAEESHAEGMQQLQKVEQRQKRQQAVRYKLVEADPGQYKDQILLYPSLIADHSAKAYRAAVLKVLRQLAAQELKMQRAERQRQ